MAASQAQINQMTALQRFNAPMPKFFKILHYVGIGIICISLFLSAAGSSLGIPETTLALISDKSVWIGGLIATLVSQFTVDGDHSTETVDSVDSIGSDSKKK